MYRYYTVSKNKRFLRDLFGPLNKKYFLNK